MRLFRHAGPEEPAPCLIRGHPDVFPKKVGNHLKYWIPVFTGNPGFRPSPEWRPLWIPLVYGHALIKSKQFQITEIQNVKVF